MKNSSKGEGRPRLARRLLVALALTVGLGAGAVMVPTPALAIPDGGWCYNNWYVFGSDNGQVQQVYGPTKFFQNNSGSTANWSESLTVSTTFSTTYSHSVLFKGGFNVLIVKAEVEYRLTVTTVSSVTVNKTTGFTTTVPPHTTMYAAYGALGQATTGTYYQEQHGCTYGNFSSVTSGAVNVFSLIGGQELEGWRLW